MEIVLGGIYGSKEALNSLQSLENNPDDDGHIIGIHFRVSKVMDCYQDIGHDKVFGLVGHTSYFRNFKRKNLFW